MQKGTWKDLHEWPLGYAPEGGAFFRWTGWYEGLYNTPSYQFADEEGYSLSSSKIRLMSDEEIAHLIAHRGPAPLRYWVVPRSGLSHNGKPMDHRVVLERAPVDGVRSFGSEIPAGYAARKLSNPEEYLGWLLSIDLNLNGNGGYGRLLVEFSEDAELVAGVNPDMRLHLQATMDWMEAVGYIQSGD